MIVNIRVPGLLLPVRTLVPPPRAGYYDGWTPSPHASGGTEDLDTSPKDCPPLGSPPDPHPQPAWLPYRTRHGLGAGYTPKLLGARSAHQLSTLPLQLKHPPQWMPAGAAWECRPRPPTGLHTWTTRELQRSAHRGPWRHGTGKATEAWALTSP